MHVKPESTLNFERLVSSLAVPMMVLDRDLKFVLVNDPYCSAVHKTAQELLGVYMFEAFPDEPIRVASVRSQFEKALAGEISYLSDQPYMLEEGDGTWVERIWKAVQLPYIDEHGQITHMIQRCEDITEQATLRRQNDVISAELDHRVRNMLAVVESVAMLTSATSNSIDDFSDAFSSRLASMSRNFTQLSTNKWTGLSLRSVLETELSQFISPDSNRIRIDGPVANLSIKSTKDASLIIHELVTNAAKYGFLSKPTGELDVSWSVSDTELTIAWSETGLHGVTPPTREGFGTQILSMMPNLNVQHDYRNEGLTMTFAIPVSIAVSGLEFQPA